MFLSYVINMENVSEQFSGLKIRHVMNVLCQTVVSFNCAQLMISAL